MLTKKRKLSLAGLSMTLIAPLTFAMGISPANADSTPVPELPEHIESQIDDTDGSSAILYAPEIAEQNPEGSWIEVSDDSVDGEFQSYSNLNPTAVSSCLSGVNVGALASYSSLHNGQVSLMCGTSSSGLRHIQSHSLDWIAKMGGFGGTWYDYMSFGVDAAVQAPSTTTVRPANNTRCYTTPIEVYDSAGAYWQTFYARTSVSINNQIVITAFPQNADVCS